MLKALGGYSATYPHAEDYDLWLRLLFPGPGATGASGAGGDAGAGAATATATAPNNSRRVRNLGTPLLVLQKHGTLSHVLHECPTLPPLTTPNPTGSNVSTTYATAQRHSSLVAVQAAIARLLQTKVNEWQCTSLPLSHNCHTRSARRLRCHV